MSRGAEGHAGTEGVVEPITGATASQVRQIMEIVMHYGDARASAVAAIEYGSQDECDEFEENAVALWDQIEDAIRALAEGGHDGQ